ncbi:MAG: TIGR03986 family CRISPR-associated RAMP protein [Rhodospirillaceae bacterium]|nr:TIGR03986 family CRISPR-associated RAMP protein [Rhodospirillaceae bacterium]
MTDILRGKLVFQSSKKGKDTIKVRRVVYPTKKGTSLPTQYAPDQIAPALIDNQDETVEVDLELEGGKPVRIRPAGEPWAGAPAAAPRPPHDQRRGGGPGKGGHQHGSPSQHQMNRPRAPGAFHNPYNFIPAIPLARPDKLDSSGEAKGLEQGAPCGHDRYYKDRWSGRIGIEIETITPLFIPDAARAEELPNGHKIFDLRTDKDGKPHLPPTSLKGALRSAYEAVTNSRLAVFHGHKVPLAHRMEARSGLGMVPARISDDGQAVELWLGTETRVSDRPATMYAAWLPRYDRQHGGVDRHAVIYGDHSLPEHGDEVKCWLQLYQHSRGFRYWRVLRIAKAADGLPPRPPPSTYQSRNHSPVTGEPLVEATGHVCVTNQNIGSKHDERVFFVGGGARPRRMDVDITRLKEQWTNLIKNYQDIHKDDLAKRRKNKKAAHEYLGKNPGDTAWSRHVYTAADKDLTPGTLCYAKMEGSEVKALYPVMISRELAKCAPAELLPDWLKPAKKGEGTGHVVRLGQLSPADRVFGWANQDGDGAWRGQLRIGPITCTTDAGTAIARFSEPLPLAILSAPKPQQARFYVAKDTKVAEAQEDHADKAAAAYGAGKGLRGRKVYPHPSYLAQDDLARRYWDPAAASQDEALQADPIMANGRTYYREYRRRAADADGLRDDQNRSIRAWVTPGTTFTTWIDVINLNQAELGALLWLLSLPDDPDLAGRNPVHRLGGGKPLGFGSARIRLTCLDLADGEGKRQEYSRFFPQRESDLPDKDTQQHYLEAETIGECATAVQGKVNAFKENIAELYTGQPEASRAADVPFIRAFVQAACGFGDGLPVHYPRNSQAPDPEGKNFEWFVENERTGRDAPSGNQLALDNLAGDRGLPFWPDFKNRNFR